MEFVLGTFMAAAIMYGARDIESIWWEVFDNLRQQKGNYNS